MIYFKWHRERIDALDGPVGSPAYIGQDIEHGADKEAGR